MKHTASTPERVNRLPSVSVLLPAWNEAEHIDACLDALLAIDWPNLEIIVCAGGEDDTFELASIYASERVTLLEQRPGEGKQRALRRCFAESGGEIIYLTDADCIVPGDVFRAVIAPIVSSEGVASTGTSRPAPDQWDEPFAIYQWSIQRAVERQRPDDSTGMLGRNCAVSRKALIQARAFTEPAPIGTDYHLAKTLLTNGEHIRFIPAATETRFPTGARQFVRQQSRWVRNIFLHGPRFGDRNEVVACGRTVLLGTGFYLWPLGWRWTRLPGIVLWLTAFAYLLRQRIHYGRALERETDGVSLGWNYYARLPLFTLLDVAAWTWPLIDGLSARRRVQW